MKGSVPWGNVTHDLKTAALHPQRRREMVVHALQELIISLPAIGTALVWPCQDRNIPWKIYYVGDHPESMRRWLAARLDSSLDATLSTLQKDLTKLSDMPSPHLICLQPAPMFSAGIWIIWPQRSPFSSAINGFLQEIRLTLEALIEVQNLEEHYFSSASPLSDPTWVEAVGKGDQSALSVLLSMTRLVSHAEMATWGRAYQDVIEAKDHVGARQNGYGFVVPGGHGMSGHIVASRTPILPIEDYRNSPFRAPSASEIIDGEQVRSVIALPVRSRIDEEMRDNVVGFLYTARRVVRPFSLAECLLVQRLTGLLEPLPLLIRPASFLTPGLPSSEQKAAWQKLILQANHVDTLETWIGQYIKGSIVVADSDGHPYVFGHNAQLEQLRSSFSHSEDGVMAISLEAPGVQWPGRIYLRSGMALPPPDWPDFFTDLVMACNLIIGRMEQALDHLAHQREQWLHTVLQEKSPTQIRQDGYRLGLPAREGQICVITWPPQWQEGQSNKREQASATAPKSRQIARKRMLVEDIILDQLNSPLLSFGNDIGVILLDKQAELQPSKLHDALLPLFTPHPCWIVYGTYYHSLHELKLMLTHAISLAQKARRAGTTEYLLDIQTPGLESLLTNPKLTDYFHKFATKLLTPLLDYDKEGKGTELTTTFVLAQLLGSAQAVSDELGVHVNTIRYRLHKAEDILGIEELTPEERIAWELASFIWMRSHRLTEETVS